jgi:tRNA-Thr(GGU) m(6)t(6)A37 methyltransferase TsaA
VRAGAPNDDVAVDKFVFRPIGFFACDQHYPQQAPRQGRLQEGGKGRVELLPGLNLEQAVQDLQGFEKIWLIYVFDRNQNWKPLVSPPRGASKRGVFATRAPYRPNPIGLSCVTLLEIRGRQLLVGDFDLLDGTPILDIKPYLAYADSFPHAAAGWLETETARPYILAYAELARQQVEWITRHGGYDIGAFIVSQLSESPCDKRRKRITPTADATAYVIAARTWRIHFDVDEENRRVAVQGVSSGYDSRELQTAADSYGDKAIHRAYNLEFSDGR